jgi:hypothetical protein
MQATAAGASERRRSSAVIARLPEPVLMFMV